VVPPAQGDDDPGQHNDEEDDMSVEENEAITWRAYDTAINRRDIATALRCFAPGYRCHVPQFPEPVGLDAYEAQGRMMLAAFPDLTVRFEQAFGEGDLLVTRHVFTGTHEGDLMGVTPTGKQVTFGGTDIYRFTDGRIAEEWPQSDYFGLLIQLGAIPSFGA
jgi:predicted ester cyclase